MTIGEITAGLDWSNRTPQWFVRDNEASITLLVEFPRHGEPDLATTQKALTDLRVLLEDAGYVYRGGSSERLSTGHPIWEYEVWGDK